jgi:hypothetical protein
VPLKRRELRFHLTPVRMAIFKSKNNNKCCGENAVKQEALYTVGRNSDYYNHYGKQYGDSLKKTKARTAK